MNAAARRQQILEAGHRLFVKQGFMVTTIEEIAKNVKIARTTVYEYFSSKDDILLALIEPMILQHPKDLPEGDTKSKLIYLIQSSLNQLQENKMIYRIFFEEFFDLEEETAQFFKNWQNLKLAQVYEIIREGIASDCFSRRWSYMDIGFAYQALLEHKMRSLIRTGQVVDTGYEATHLVNLLWLGIGK
ncbi:TetR/AcrR family transcriptional regulator [Petrocella sp. FN5]|uniref:TetR/AcrR family transcriptional regulator n=1 Tax=Petrocella sp. FN5 TaxID=3032002 RepID=UPI0023DBC881|nr:TetR/AcrR family transcriptional regulator [Petrocella sp. FN5]MDF1615859.1 TetR/AcrR family transcriptional regulator [Petrocella sp. FN5]